MDASYAPANSKKCPRCNKWLAAGKCLPCESGAPREVFPDCVGKTYAEAEEIIRKERPNIALFRMAPGEKAPARETKLWNRVRLYVDENDVVNQVPKIW